MLPHLEKTKKPICPYFISEEVIQGESIFPEILVKENGFILAVCLPLNQILILLTFSQ